LAQAGSNIVMPMVRQGRLEVVLADRAIRLRGLYAVYPSRRFAPRRLREFVDFMVERFQKRRDLVWST
jgi:DNA-binding transcriptional LysR family regulator